MLLHDLRKVKFLQLEVSVPRSQFCRGRALRLELSSPVDPDCVSHFAFLCYSTAQARQAGGGQGLADERAAGGQGV